MDKKPMFYGKSVAIDLARVMAFERPSTSGITEFLVRRKLKVTLVDGTTLTVDGDDDTDGFVTAFESFNGAR